MKFLVTASIFFYSIFVPLHISSPHYSFFGSHICWGVFVQGSLQFIKISFLAVTFVLSHLWPHEFLVSQIYFFFLIYAISFKIAHVSVCIQNSNTDEVLSWLLQIFYIWKPYLFLQIYDIFNIPYLAVIFSFFFFFFENKNAYKIYTTIDKCFTYGSHICS